MAVVVDIEKDFGSFKLQVSFRSGKGTHGLLGASGCGKSMTLRCIAGVVKPDRGHIEVDGRVFFDSASKINLSPRERQTGLLFQNYALFPNMTVEKNLMCVLRGREKGEARQKIEHMLRRFNLSGMEKRRPSQLSGGQQQRVALARILLTDPSILLLDEPFSALDSYLRWQMELEVAGILETFPGTTLLVTHSRDEVRHLCATVTVLDRGQGRGVMTADSLFEKPDTLSACLLSGCKNFSRAVKLDDYTVYALDWDAKLKTRERVSVGITYVGVRAHYIIPAEGPGENVLPCQRERVVNGLFSTVVMMSTSGSGTAFSKLRVELGKESWDAISHREIQYMRIAPETLMLLRSS